MLRIKWKKMKLVRNCVRVQVRKETVRVFEYAAAWITFVKKESKDEASCYLINMFYYIMMFINVFKVYYDAFQSWWKEKKIRRLFDRAEHIPCITFTLKATFDRVREKESYNKTECFSRARCQIIIFSIKTRFP